MKSLRVAIGAVVLAGAAVISPALARAQTPPEPAAPADTIPAGWQDGFMLQSPDGDNRLVVGFVGQTDGRFSVDDPTPIVNTFLLRKVRPGLSGRVARYFDFRFVPDFGSGTVTVLDAYFDIQFSPKFRVRSGKDKTPIGYEMLMRDAYLFFPERALASSLMPNRDVGIQAQGELAQRKVFYSGGVFNGVPDGANSTTDVDANNGKDLAGRVVFEPFTSASAGTALSGLGLQLGGSRGAETGALPSFKTSAGQTYFSYASAAAASGPRERWTPAIFYYYKAVGAFAEYMRSGQRVSKPGVDANVDNHAWEVTGSIVVTGEAASDHGLRPKRPFNPATGSWGALQFLARYSTLSVDPIAFTDGLAAAGASADARSFTIAANWYPAAFIKYYLTFERTTFGAASGTARPDENVILFRTQVAF